MQRAANDRVVFAGLAALTLASIGLKAIAGPPRDGSGDWRRAEIAAQLDNRLRHQGFSTSLVPLHIQSPIVLGRRGACKLSVRDARSGKAMMTQFARDASSIGAVRYLYKGRSYSAPPALRIRLGRFESELIERIGGGARAHIPVALATSPGCGRDDFDLGDIALAA